MTCYFRHIGRVFEEIGIEVTKENKRDIDQVIHKMVGVDYKDCSNAWREVKKRLAEDEEGFINSLRSLLS
ncbi:MAG: hypothetical protein ACW975_01160 [Candidatus Thorarchaeota archaeon]|jgi:hypothetical protein